MSESRTIGLFDEWAKTGRADSMAEGHAPAVRYMLERAHQILVKERQSYRSIDIGCGVGWAVRWLNGKVECKYSMGIDAATTMIERARELDVERNDAYICADIETWTPESPVDLVTSMEVVYYLNRISSFLMHVQKSWLRPGGLFIAGLDHHPDNPRSASWSSDLDLRMDRSDDNIWHARLIDAGFSNVETWYKKLEGRKDVTLFIQGRRR